MIRIRAYVALIAMMSVIATALLYRLAPTIDPRFPTAAIAFALLGLFSQVLAHGLARSASGSIAFIPFVAAAALAPSWITPLAVAGALLLGQLLYRTPAMKLVFNVAQHGLATSVATMAYLLLGGKPLLTGQFQSPIAFIVLFSVFMALNTLSVSTAIALSEQRNIARVWRENTLGSLPYDLLSLPVVYGFTVVFGQLGALGAIALAVPLIGIRQQYKTNWQLAKVNQELLQLMVASIEARDPYTSGHSQRVSRYAVALAHAAGLRPKQIDRVGVAALLHDVGKIYEEYGPILRKPDRLTEEENAIMQTHAARGADLVSMVSHLQDLVGPIKHHHENWDGTGYPDALAGTGIPLFARVIKIADTIDAMATDRPYRSALTERDIRNELIKYRGRQFDPALTDALLADDLLSRLLSGARDKRASRQTPAVRAALMRASGLRPEMRAS